MVFTGDEFADGGDYIVKILKQHKVPASFFFTGRFYRNPAFKNTIRQLKKDQHYLGAHSDQHLLYCDWSKRDSLLVTRAEFTSDLLQNYMAMKNFGIEKEQAEFFLPPYEWYNDSIAAWTRKLGFKLINYTPGTLSHTDYTTPQMKNYKASAEIYASILKREQNFSSGLSGFILLVHISTDAGRTDKFYYKLNELITNLKRKGYSFVKINGLLN